MTLARRSRRDAMARAHSIWSFSHEEQKPEPMAVMPLACISIHLTLPHPAQKSEGIDESALPCR